MHISAWVLTTDRPTKLTTTKKYSYNKYNLEIKQGFYWGIIIKNTQMMRHAQTAVNGIQTQIVFNRAITSVCSRAAHPRLFCLESMLKAESLGILYRDTTPQTPGTEIIQVRSWILDFKTHYLGQA